MNACLKEFEPLGEDERLDYLHAMDIPIWILRDKPLLEIKESDEKDLNEKNTKNVENVEGFTLKTNLETAIVTTQPSHEKVILKHSDNLKEAVSNQAELAIPQEKNGISSKCFLKMVNWKSKNSADKSLLIICRHQIDQPAQSFAKSNGPSQFMNDYIQAINDLIVKQEFDIQVQLAHLTEAGLGHDNQPLQKTLAEINPNIVLLLGDESIKLLLNRDQEVAQLRGQLQNIELIDDQAVQLIENTDKPIRTKVLVSYHPYTLIQNPQLKKLALEDLSLLVKILINT